MSQSVVLSAGLRIESEKVFQPDHDQIAKLIYLSFVYNEAVTDVSYFDDLEFTWMYTNWNHINKLIPCDTIFAEKNTNALDSQGSRCGKSLRPFIGEFLNNATRPSGTQSDHDTVLMKSTDLTKPSDARFDKDVYAMDSIDPKYYVSARKPLQGRNYRAVRHADNAWVEVFRVVHVEGTKFSDRSKQEGKYGCWFHPLKGTGVFVNVGRTLVFEHKNRKKEYHDSITGRKVKVFADSACPGALELGYDSVQFMEGDSGYPELVMCSGGCTEELVREACPSHKSETSRIRNEYSVRSQDRRRPEE